MQKTKVTIKQWTALMGDELSRNIRDAKMSGKSFSGLNLGYVDMDDSPAISSWFEALEYANRLSVTEGLNPAYKFVNCDGSETPLLDVRFDGPSPIYCGKVEINSPDGSPYSAEGYRIPTEVEWEFAAKGGRDQMWYFWAALTDPFFSWRNNRPDLLPNFEYYGQVLPDFSYPSASARKMPNQYGVFDMIGKWSEWTFDTFAMNYGYGGGFWYDPCLNSEMGLKYFKNVSSYRNSPENWEALHQVKAVRGSSDGGLIFSSAARTFDWIPEQSPRDVTNLGGRPSFRLVRTAI